MDAFIYHQRDIPDICMGGDDFAKEAPPSLDFGARIHFVFEYIQGDGQSWLLWEAGANHDICFAFEPELKWVIFPIRQVHDLGNQSMGYADRLAIMIAPGGAVVVTANEVDQPLKSIPRFHALFRKVEACSYLDLTGRRFDDGYIFIIVVDDEAVLCFLFVHIVCVSFHVSIR